jgi:hypothetical protein
VTLSAALPLFPTALCLILLLGLGTLLLAPRTTGRVPAPTLSALRGVGPALIVAAAIGAGLPTLSGDFLGDDFGWVHLFHDRPISEIFVLRDISHGVWGGLPLDELRPLFPLSFRLNAAVVGSDPRGYHAANVILHALNTLLVYGLGRLLLGRALPSFVGALFYAWAPGHAEAIAWVSGRVDLLPTAFYLGGFVAYLAWRQRGGSLPYLTSLFLFAVGLFSKEILITLPFLLLLSDLLRGPWKGWRDLLLPTIPFGACGLGYLVLRRVAFGNFAREGRHVRLGAFLTGQVNDLRTFLPPLDLVRHGSLSVLGTLVAGLLLGFLLAALVSLEKRSIRTLLLVGPVFYGVTVLPLLVTYASPRHLYLPSAGPLLALALLAVPREGPVPAWRIAGAALFLAACVPSLWRHEAAWAQASALSRDARRGIAEAAEGMPDGSLVAITGIPNELGETMVWDFALPFALEAPFLERDLYARLRIIESPGIYCCPAGEWFEGRKALLASLLTGSGAETLEAYSLHWNPRRKGIVSTRGLFTRDALRSRVVALGGRPELPRDAAEAQALAPSLLEAIRGLCGD